MVGLLGYPAPVIAYAGAWGENAGFYGAMAAIELAAQTCADRERSPLDGCTHHRGMRYLKRLTATTRVLVLEFGAAELLDSLVVRPAAMAAAGALSGSLPGGILLGKFIADAVFYVPTIIAFEWRTRAARAARLGHY